MIGIGCICGIWVAVHVVGARSAARASAGRCGARIVPLVHDMHRVDPDRCIVGARRRRHAAPLGPRGSERVLVEVDRSRRAVCRSAHARAASRVIARRLVELDVVGIEVECRRAIRRCHAPAGARRALRACGTAFRRRGRWAVVRWRCGEVVEGRDRPRRRASSRPATSLDRTRLVTDGEHRRRRDRIVAFPRRWSVPDLERREPRWAW